MGAWYPALGEWFPLDEATVRTDYLKAKAARLAADPGRVTHLPAVSTPDQQWFLVVGDHGSYNVCLRPLTTPWRAACSRDGEHESTPDGRACAHALAAAAVWVRHNTTLRAEGEGIVSAHIEEVPVNG
jgi:hypothetical protein